MVRIFASRTMRGEAGAWRRGAPRPVTNVRDELHAKQARTETRYQDHSWWLVHARIVRRAYAYYTNK